MTAAESAPRRAKSKPARVADEIEANGRGWTVERTKTGSNRIVRAEHPDGRYVEMEWQRNADGRDVFGFGFAATSVDDDGEEFTNVAAMLRQMAAAPDVPFALNDDDATVLAALAGRTVTWRNSISGREEDDIVPRGGIHLRLNQTADGWRVLTFAGVTGFHSVRIDRIVKVS